MSLSNDSDIIHFATPLLENSENEAKNNQGKN